MDKQEQSEEVKQAKKEALTKGVAYDELIRREGWKFIQEFIETKIKLFANDAINGFEDFDQYEYKRGEVQGMRMILGEVQSHIKLMEDDRSTKK